MHQHDFYAYVPQQHDVFHDLLFQGFVDHGVAAVFDDHNLAAVFFYVWQRFHQNLGAFCIGIGIWHVMTPLLTYFFACEEIYAKGKEMARRRSGTTPKGIDAAIHKKLPQALRNGNRR